MSCDIKQLWDSVFGSGWEKFSESCPDIGAFLLCHRCRQTMCDKNSLRLSGFHHTPGYDELSASLANLDELEDDDTQVKIIIVEDSERCKAGYIRLRNEHTYEFPMELPLCTHTRLITDISKNTAPSLLALVQLEEYGNPNISIDAISEAVFAIMGASPEKTLLSAVTRNKFWLYVPDFSDDKVKFLEELQNVVKKCLEKSSDYSLRRRSITFTAGCGDERKQSSQRMHAAEFTLFEAIAKGIGSICLYSDELYEQQKNEYDKMRRFTKLMDNNLFTYHFQPIVSARNGDIVAYEALMRTEKGIDMYPLEILSTASKLDRMYDIEKATMTNVLRYVSENQELFKNKKLFVNSIPAYMLSIEDWDSLVQDYGELMEKLVIEMTEQTEIDNDRLAIIHDRLSRSNIPLAIDDYGTGYSNTANLLRYNPDYVKIDRSLIDGINNKPKVEKLVLGLIEFIHANGFSALAEGVETTDELKTMIRLGADLIQGYYLSKPKPFILNEITPSLCEEIQEYNRIFASEIMKVYHPDEGETVDVCHLAKENYSLIFVENDNIVLKGHKNARANITVQIKDGLKTRLTLKNCCIVSEKDEQPTIGLGNETEAEILLEGNNECIHTGIHVPQTSSLRILGSGSLYIKSESADCYGIGSDSSHNCGNITLEGSGKLNIISNGDNSVAIGGGRNADDSCIKILGGDIKINCSGINCVGIGVFESNSTVSIVNCCMDMEISAANVVCIGSQQGDADIDMDNFNINSVLSGHDICGVGTINGESGNVILSNGTFDCNIHGRTANCIGGRYGAVDCSIKNSTVKLYCESSNVVGIGNFSDNGSVDISESSLSINLRAKEGRGIAVREERFTTFKSNEDIVING